MVAAHESGVRNADAAEQIAAILIQAKAVYSLSKMKQRFVHYIEMQGLALPQLPELKPKAVHQSQAILMNKIIAERHAVQGAQPTDLWLGLMDELISNAKDSDK